MVFVLLSFNWIRELVMSVSDDNDGEFSISGIGVG